MEENAFPQLFKNVQDLIDLLDKSQEKVKNDLILMKSISNKSKGISFEDITGMTKERAERLRQISIEMQSLEQELLTYGITLKGKVSFEFISHKPHKFQISRINPLKMLRLQRSNGKFSWLFYLIWISFFVVCILRHLQILFI